MADRIPVGKKRYGASEEGAARGSAGRYDCSNALGKTRADVAPAEQDEGAVVAQQRGGEEPGGSACYAVVGLRAGRSDSRSEGLFACL